MRVGSLFSGIGGFDLGLERAGFEVVWQAERDAFCNRVLAAHWPEVKRYGDVRDIRVGSGADNVACKSRGSLQGHKHHSGVEHSRVDLICGGFPCQDLSVAGKRAGLDGERSGLWFEFKRILQELRPSWALIENVPGLLSSNQGRDFAVVLDGLGECGFGGIAWAVLDSQHFGVPQRRRRVYVVAGPSRRSVEQVLSLCESCGGHPQTSRATGEDLAPCLNGSANRTGGDRPPGTQVDTATSLIAVIQDAREVEKDQNGLGVEVSEVMYTLDSASQHAVAFTERTRNGERNFEASEELSYALTNPGSGGRTHSRQLYDGAAVRRLTPTECERLQGFPDGWTDIGKAADGPRYKALGNAVSVPVIEYLGLRIKATDACAIADTAVQPAPLDGLGNQGDEEVMRVKG